MIPPREIPVAFDTGEVLATLAGQKSQFRRIVTVPWRGSTRSLPYEPYYVEADGQLLVDCSDAPDGRGGGDYREFSSCTPARYGRAGDRLWVKEAFSLEQQAEMHDTIAYRADGAVYERGGPELTERFSKASFSASPKTRWRSPLHMPRWASRLTLEVTRVRVELLQAITEDGARAEGVDAVPMRVVPRQGTTCFRDDFGQLWDLSPRTRDSTFPIAWKDNPWVWVVEYRRVET